MSYGYSSNPYIDSAIARWHDKWLQEGAPEYEEEDEQEENEEDEQEEKAKAYDEALERARRLNVDNMLSNEDIEEIFHELKESEDERIIEEIKFAVMQMPSSRQDTKNRCLAWLEKQKEQKPVVTHGETYHVDTLGTQQVIAGKMSQKPAEWSEEDENVYKTIMDDFNGITPMSKAYKLKAAKWLKSILERCSLQPKQEWSDEDADMLNCCISSIEEAKENRYAYKETDGDTSYDREIDWLNSLRPQPHTVSIKNATKFGNLEYERETLKH